LPSLKNWFISASLIAIILQLLETCKRYNSCVTIALAFLPEPP
jgi:hypothetical protein